MQTARTNWPLLLAASSTPAEVLLRISADNALKKLKKVQSREVCPLGHWYSIRTSKNFYSFILKSEIRGYKRTFASQFWIFWACFVYFFLISPGNTFEKRQQKQRLAFFSKLCWDENHNIKPDLIAKSQNIPLFIKKKYGKNEAAL